jgi:hypothetical protein
MTVRIETVKRVAGICRAAKSLGISRQYLREVIIGRRKSPRILSRFRQLQAGGQTR